VGRGALVGAAALLMVACGGTAGGRVATSPGGGQPGAPSAADGGERSLDAGPVDAGTASPDGGLADAGTSHPDAGTGGGGEPDAGSTDGGGEPDAGSPDGGGGEPDAGSADGGSATDAGSGDGGTGTDGGVLTCQPTPEPAVASCDELLPRRPLDPPHRSLGPPLASPADPVCQPGPFSGDQEGFLGVMRTVALDQDWRVSQLELDVLSPDGQVFRSPSESTKDFFLTVPLPRGAGVVRFDGDAQGTLVSIDRTGALAEQAVGMARSVAAMPGGGTVVAEGGTLYTPGRRKLTAPLRITRRDEAGSTVWSTAIPTSIVAEPSEAQVYPNSAGHVMVVVAVDGFQVRLVWLDEQGHIASTGEPQGTFSSLAPIRASLELPGGSLAFGISPAHSAGDWVVVQDLDPHLDAAPCWLDQRKETRVFSIRGGRGYAVFHGTTFSGTETRTGLEIVTSSGESCGWVEASCGDPTPGPCDLSGASVGLDGTLYLGGISKRQPQECLVESWPALLQ